MGARYHAQCRSRPEIRLKFAPNLPLFDRPSSTGARRSTDMDQPMKARCEVRWDGAFDRPPTPSTAGDMADRVVGRQRDPIPLFCAAGAGQKKGGGAGVSHQRARGNILLGDNSHSTPATIGAAHKISVTLYR